MKCSGTRPPAGVASDGTMAIRDIVPTELHQRTPLYIGSPDDVADALRFVGPKA